MSPLETRGPDVADESAGKGVVMLSGVRDGVPVLWHEAVAVVSGLANWVTDNGPDARVPDLDHIGFSPSGDVFVFPGGKTDPDHVKALASLLLAVLADSPAPAPLVELAAPRASGAVQEPLDAFVKALQFFQRPNPAHDVQTLAVRIDNHLMNLASDKQLATLKQKVQKEQRQAGQKKPRLDHRRGDDRTPRWLGTAVVVLLLAGLAGSAYYFRSDLVQLLGWLRGGDTVGATRSNAPGPEEPAASRPRPRRPTPEAHLPATGPVGPATEVGAPNSVWTRIWSADQPSVDAPNVVQPAFATLDFAPPDPLTPDSPATRPPVDLKVYTQADTGVTAPALVQPRLPSQPPPGVPDAQIGEIELVVDERGLVERVRLISPTNRYSERMLLSAVKAWVFAPATKDGQPVKYLTRVRLTI